MDDRLEKKAMTAFSEAQLVGLVPKGDWRNALTKLKNVDGTLLQGRELAKAKESLGKMPNNTRQMIASESRKHKSYDHEVGTFTDSMNSLSDVTKGKQVVYGQKGQVDMRGLEVPGREIPESIHTHPYRQTKYQNGVTADIVNPSRDDINNMRIDHSTTNKHKATIYDPIAGHESVSRFDEAGNLKTIYFKNKGVYAGELLEDIEKQASRISNDIVDLGAEVITDPQTGILDTVDYVKSLPQEELRKLREKVNKKETNKETH